MLQIIGIIGLCVIVLLLASETVVTLVSHLAMQLTAFAGVL